MAQVMLDRIGWAYIGLAIAWTVALACGMLFLYMHRQLPCLRIRRLPILFTGVVSLHVYGVVCVLGYPIGAIVPCNAEFWVMSIYLPLGYALFHAANTQFLHIASRQKQYAHMSNLRDHKPVGQEKAERLANNRWKRMSHGVERADKVDRMMVFIAIGFVVQVVLTLFVFFSSEKFHPGYGLFNWTVEGTATEVRMKCSKGWEWWLSIVWQFFWAWIYAPYMLWKSRNVRDVHGWRVQTICCCLAGLPPSPLWLAGLYVPQMAAVNAYFPPFVWFSVSIIFFEIFTIAFPIFQVYKTQALRQETLDAIASWERRQQLNLNTDGTVVGSEAESLKSGAYTGTTIRTAEMNPVIKTSFESQKSDMFTMAALENALRTNADPLLQFAALKDFSGENVSFLTHIADWRRFWFTPKSSTAEHRRSQFIAAVRIYASFVSLEFSDFPINISSREMKNLHKIFEGPATILMRSGSISSNTSDSATPFDNMQPDDSSTTDLKTGINLSALGRANLRSASRLAIQGGDDALANIAIPDEFTEMVFNLAEEEIKYLVLTNTWTKFVNAGYSASELGEDVKLAEPSWWKKKVLCSN